MNPNSSISPETQLSEQRLTVPHSFMAGLEVELQQLCIQQLFESQVTKTPDAIAVELAGQSLTYKQLNQHANQFAHHLIKLGVGPDVLVGVSLERSLDLVVAIYGILKSGGAYVPLDPSYPADRIHYMARSADLHSLITHSTCTHLYQDLGQTNLVLVDQSTTTVERESTDNPPCSATGDNLIYVIFTSGSTGQPKAAAVYHKGFTNLVQWFVKEFAINSDDRALLISSMSFDLTQKNLYATLIAGGTLHLYPSGPYDLSVLSRLIKKHGISLINCTPSAFYPLIDPFDESSMHSLESLRVVFLGGEPISTTRIKPWLTHPTCIAEVANTYGPTECTDICGFYRLTRENLDQYSFVPLGRPVFNVQMAILNEDMQPCTIGEPGELCVGGAGVGPGYINDAAMTQAKFVANHLPDVTSDVLYRTGDQGRWHADGVIEFLGRLDHQVKIRGFRIELPEIERALETHAAVSEAIVVVKPTLGGGEPQLACGFTNHHGQSISIEDLRDHLTEKLPAHMIPSFFKELDKFPLSPNGKVDRKALAIVFQDNNQKPDAVTTDSVPPIEAGKLESQIHTAWCQLLERSSADLDESFFDLGGDSLQLARLHQELQTMLNREFPITDLFAHPTIRGMAKHLGGDSDSNSSRNAMRDRAKRQRAAQMAQRRNRR